MKKLAYEIAEKQRVERKSKAWLDVSPMAILNKIKEEFPKLYEFDDPNIYISEPYTWSNNVSVSYSIITTEEEFWALLKENNTKDSFHAITANLKKENFPSGVAYFWSSSFTHNIDGIEFKYTVILHAPISFEDVLTLKSLGKIVDEPAYSRPRADYYEPARTKVNCPIR